MKKMKVTLALLLSMCMMAGCGQNEVSAPSNKSISLSESSSSPTESEPEKVNKDFSIMEYVDAMSPGWNLGNSLDATGGETSWGNPAITKELISAIKASGYNSIRVPVTWNIYIDEEYNIDPTYMSRVKEVVDWCLEEDLYVMINLHHDSWEWISSYNKDKTVIDKFNSVWTQISEAFKDYDMRLMFESVNEPYFDGGDQQAMLDELNVSFFNIVRNSGGNNDSRPLVIPALATSAETKNCSDLMNTISGLNDPHIIATVHYYAPWTFSVNIAGSYKFDESIAKEIKTAFDVCYDELVSKGVPVVVGEYGVLGTVEAGEYYKYINCLNEVTRGRGMTLMKWDNGGGFDRYGLKWRDEYEQALIIACADSDSSYTERDMLFVTDTPADITHQLYLNGNSLKEISADETVLTPEKDYTLTDNSVTFSGDFLGRFAQGDYGKKAVLTLSFSDGADWHIAVYYSALPEYGALTARAQSMRIPVKFNGNIVTALEAVDPESGGGVGPHDWTTFKEFNYAFTVNYESGFITPTKEFKKEFSGDSVLFRIHYANETVEEYLMNIKDGVIVGAPVDREATYKVSDNISADSGETEAAEEEFTGNKVLASLDVSELNADSFATEATFVLNDGEEPSICLRLNDTDDQYYYLGSKEYNDWFQSYPHLGGVLVQSSGTYEGATVDYGSISSLAVETWGSAVPESMKIYLYANGELVGTAEYTSESSQLIII